MKTTRRPYAGRTRAVGFLLDPALVGADETARRIAALWTRGATVRAVDSRLLVQLPAAVDVRAERALGLPVEGDGSTIELRQDGEVRHLSTADLPEVGADRFVDLSDVIVDHLEPAPAAPPPIPEAMTGPARPTPTPFRSVAGVPDVDARTRRQIASLKRQVGSSTGTGPGLRDRLLGRAPSPGRLLGRRNQRYVEELSRDFKAQNWDRALRSAIGVGGLTGHGWAFRTPRRDKVTGPRTARPSGGGGLGLADNLQQHLRQLYTHAAAQLEREGQVMLAAFVHADLLNNPLAAIEVIERSGDYRAAAELAEGWISDPALSVRLWWRAGERGRAVEVARTRGAFADAVSRLEKVDLDGAVALRREWVQHLQSAGDHLGAVQAAWPAQELRSSVAPDLAVLVSGEGRASGLALAHLLELSVEASCLTSARNLLRGEATPSRDGLISELVDHRVADPGTDRELTSLALLALARDNGDLAQRTIANAVKVLQRRADPLVVADLPRVAARSDVPSTAIPRLDLTDHGSATVYDAVAVGENLILVALGERGLRLLGSRGQVRGEWDIPAHSLVIADHGNRVLVAAPRGDRCLVHQLDLPNGRPQLLPSLPSAPLSSYDGVSPVLATPSGIEWLQLANDRWKVVWRELTEGQVVHEVQRSAIGMAAAFQENGRLSVWHWHLPSRILSQRGIVELPWGPVAINAGGMQATIESGSGIAKLSWHAVAGHRLGTADHYTDGDIEVSVDGYAYLLRFREPRGHLLSVFADWHSPAIATGALPADVRPILRAATGLITVAHTGGRVVTIDPERRRAVADVVVNG